MSRKAAKRVKRAKYQYDFYKDGVTQSMIGLWLSCRRQCELAYVNGWTPNTESLPLAYGNCMHWALHQIYEQAGDDSDLTTYPISGLISQFSNVWHTHFDRRPAEAMLDQHELVCGIAEATLPSYLKRAATKDRHYNDPKRQWTHLEHVFSVPIELLDGTTYINGKIDGVFAQGKVQKSQKLWLFETKNLGRIDEANIVEMLPHNFQVNLYLWALSQISDRPIGGVLYNITRRPQLRQGVKESRYAYLQRIAADVAERPDWYFMRFEMPTSRKKIKEWEDEILMPLLIAMSAWWEELQRGGIRSYNTYMNPNALVNAYGRCSMFNIIVRGDTSGYHVRRDPFPELEF